MNVYIRYKAKVTGVLVNSYRIKEICRDALRIHYNPRGKYIDILFTTDDTPEMMTFAMDDILEWRIND